MAENSNELLVEKLTAKIYAGQSCVKAKTTRLQVFAPKLVAVKECLVQEVI